MIKRIFTFFKEFSYLLFQPQNRVFSLLVLFKSLWKYDRKSALSILFLSVESLASVFKYRNRGKVALNLIEREKLVKASGKSLFILGSGPTVNDYTENEWQHIRKNDSWAFNLWFCHEFVPSVYLAQALIEPKTNKSETLAFNTNKMLCKMIEDKQVEYNNADFFIRGDAVNKQEFYRTEFGNNLEKILGRNGAFLAEMPVSSTNRISPNILLDKFFTNGFFRINRSVQVIPKFGSTVTELISLALMLGYKEIILCGIDMNDGGHFYDNEETFKRYPYLEELSNINHNRTSEGGHEHMDSSIRPFTIKEYIIALRSFAKMKFNAEIFVMREESALYPEIPKYKYDV